MRLIDADALRDALGITGTKDSCKGCKYNKRFNYACKTDDAPSFDYVCEAIDEAPTVKAIPVEQLLSNLPKYDDYIHTKTYPYDETMEDIYSKGNEDGWNACLKAIKEELDYWEKENESIRI